MMATHNMYVQIIFDEKTKKFNCYADLGEVLTTLNDGDVFTISQQDTTNVLGTIKYSEDCKPYGYYFVSNDGQLTIELNDGMYLLNVNERMKMIDEKRSHRLVRPFKF